MALFVLCVFFFQIVAASDQLRNEGILQHINTGMQFAKNFLGSESVALKVANFVVRAFQTTNQPTNAGRPVHDASDKYSSSENISNERNENYNTKRKQFPASPWRHLVKLLGLQPNQISAVAVNALIFVAQMITTFLAGKKNGNKISRNQDPTNWILNKNSQRLQELIATAKNDSLTDLINELIVEQESEEETSCIRLLVCKLAPFVAKMQKTVFDGEEHEENGRKINGADILYRHLPTSEEINNRNDICERKYKECDLNE